MIDYRLVPVDPTPEMVEAAEDAYMPFGDMELAVRMALLAAPVVQGEPSRESSMVVLERDEYGKPAVWCDPEIADLVSALNEAGIRTVASCSGHGHRPGNIMLADGRELVIARYFDEARKIDAMFPGINGDPPAVQGEPVGRVKTVGGYPDESEHTVEWLCKYKDLKDGDLLYTAPQPAEQQPAEAQTTPDWDAAPPGATHYQPHQDAYYKRVSASEWYVWSRKDDREPMRWHPSLGTGDNAEWFVRPAETLARDFGYDLVLDLGYAAILRDPSDLSQQPAEQQPISAYACTVPDDCETLHWRGQILSMNELASVAQPAAGAEIMVNAPGDVYTLPMQPSGLTSGPRFVVHVPAQQSAEQKPCPEAVREGAPYDDPAFSALCREHEIWGTAAAAQCAVFWEGGKRSAEQQPAPDVTQLVEALDFMLRIHDLSGSPEGEVTRLARAALAAHRQGGEE